jgi:DNA-binding NarL/FixJ family response regulator
MSRVVVVDDHPVFRKGLIALLRASGFDVVGEAASGPEAIEIVDRERPDVVLMDLGLPEMGGVTATERITAAYPGLRVVVITLYDDEESVRAALESGASGYVIKEASPDQIIAAIRAAEAGALWLGSGVPRPGYSAPERAAATLPGLTRRESGIAELIGKGLTNQAIAERLGLSTKTVANYVSIILLKLGADDRIEAARIVRESLDRR